MGTGLNWAVILGASEGTGAAIARALSSDPGLNIYGVHRGRFPDKATEVERDVTALGRTAIMRVGDAGNAEAAKVGADDLFKVAGPRSVAVFVHSIANASLGRFVSGEDDQLAPRQFQKTFESMAHSFVYWTQELAARDLLAPSARLLGLTNPLHESLVRNCGLVAAAKAALEMYVRHLAFELGPRGFRVNLLKFPTVVTPAVRRVYGPVVMDRLESAHARMTPAGRMCTVEEVARFVSVLAGESTAWMNGATIDFSGGMTQSLLDSRVERNAMNLSSQIALTGWLTHFRAMRIYHRYEVEGIEILDRPGAALVVGYHGKPWAYDMCMLTVSMYERLGYMPHGIAHSAFVKAPITKWLIDGLGFVTGDGEDIAAAVAKGEHILVQPGGTREGYRSSLHRYRVDWGQRTGYLRLALRHGLPIIPVAAKGIDDGFLGLNDGYTLAKRLRVPYGLPLWLGIGPLGLFPISPPFPVKIKQFIGEPIDLNAEGPVDPADKPALLRLHGRVTGAVQDLLDRANR